MSALASHPVAEPTASSRIARRRSTAPLSARDTTTATAPSTGTSQSYMHSGSEIMRADR
jgi:hypothetical protein